MCSTSTRNSFSVHDFTDSLVAAGYDNTGMVADPSSLPEYDRHNVESALRRPTWRYDRAITLYDAGGRYSPMLDGPMTTAFLRMHGIRNRLLRAGVSPVDFPIKCPLHLRHMIAAEEFFLHADSWRKACLEARILAGQESDQISEACCLSVQAVHWYERLFFQVADRLQAPDWIIGSVIGPIAQAGIDEVSQEHALRFLGYIGGEHIVEQLVRGGSSHQIPTSASEVYSFLDSRIQVALRVQTYLGISAMKPSRFDTNPLLSSYAKQQDLDLRATGESEQASWIRSYIESVAKNTQVPRGSEIDKLPSDSHLRSYSVGCVELRADEQNRYSKGGLPYFDRLQAFKLPEPNSQVNIEDE
ncbi:hypothetical protein [Aureliella helgolandensis]|uniref:Uncharacterized protein n=1 Tax=Aureliella helgolandensis TaxID=2527968 RepID=A0A518G9Q0_9BACT|nr:hypothetical protein [Aureliella helgolandensis]QDV25325.1 hypothetical protein Q31a_36490 [Aureliella helgolandensis]